MNPKGARLEIARVLFGISADASIAFQNCDPLYRTFIRSGARSRRPPDIRLRPVPGPFPDLGALPVLFDTGESWSLRADRNIRWLTLHPERHPRPLWAARFDRRAARARLYGDPWPFGYPLDQLLLMHFLADRRDGILAHAAGLLREGGAAIFAGTSGAGKSTLARLFEAEAPGCMLSDERTVIRRGGRGFKAYGTPWSGTAAIARNGSAPLSAVFFLKHGRSNRLRPLDRREALDRLLPACSVPWFDAELASNVIEVCEDFVAAVPAYEFCFKPDASAPVAVLGFLDARPASSGSIPPGGGRGGAARGSGSRSGRRGRVPPPKRGRPDARRRRKRA
jgi:hypothetical protein